MRTRNQGPKLLVITSLLGLVGLGLIFFDNSQAPSTFAQQGQACQNLAGWTPGSLPDGQSVTGYKLVTASFSQTCNQLAGKLTCNNGSFGQNGNIFKYQTCTQPARANCTSPTTGTHRTTWKTLYKFPVATQTQTCAQSSRNLQCVNGSFTGTDANLYQSATCQEQYRSDCVDIWTNTYYTHLSTIQGYLSAVSSTTQSCNALKINLKCMNGQRSGSNGQRYTTGTQSSLSSACANSGVLSCQFTLGNGSSIVIPNGQSGTFFQPAALTGQSCNTGTISCSNGNLVGQYQTYNYTGCTLAQGTGCSFTGGNNTIINIPNGGSQILRNNNIVPYGGTCSSEIVSCANGNLIGAYQTHRYVGPCASASPLDCQFTGVDGSTIHTIGNGLSDTFYSTVLRAITGQNYASGCAPYSGTLTCNNGTIPGGEGMYKYTESECLDTNPLAKTCVLPRGISIPGNSAWTTGYSIMTGTYPSTCEDYGTRLTCVNGLLNGNATTYQYATCTGQGRPTQPVDLELKVQAPTAPDTMKVAQYSAPQLNISINNIGMYALSGSFTEGFLQCDWNGINIYRSRPLTQFIANPMVPQSLSITLKDVFTQSLSTKKITCRLNKGPGYYTNETAMTNNVRSGDIEVVTAARFDIAMERAIQPIKNNLDAPEITSAEGGAETIREFVYKKVMDILVPLIVVIGILSAILGFYKMFFSTDDTATEEGVKYIAYGLIGIIIIMSAKFIGNTMVGLLPEGGEITGTLMAQGVYNNIVYPFVKLGMYLVLGVMFIILVGRTLTFLFGSDDDAKKKAGTIIGRNIIAMIVIIGAKQIVEAIYGKFNQVTQDVSNLGEIGSSILADRNIPILYQIINWAMGLTSLAVLIIIIFQTFQLLMKPDSPEQMTSLKNSLIYVFIGLIIIGAGYLITNFLIIN